MFFQNVLEVKLDQKDYLYTFHQLEIQSLEILEMLLQPNIFLFLYKVILSEFISDALICN